MLDIELKNSDGQILRRLKKSLINKFIPTSCKKVADANTLVIYLIALREYESAEKLLLSYLIFDLSSVKDNVSSEYVSALSFYVYLCHIMGKQSQYRQSIKVLYDYYSDEENVESELFDSILLENYFDSISSSSKCLLLIRNWTLTEQSRTLSFGAGDFIEYWLLSTLFEQYFPLGESLDLQARIKSYLEWLEELIQC